jgi:predicted nucleic acid-binding protein
MPQKQQVVINASPLIALSAVLSDFQTLHLVAERVLVPAEVFAEIRAGPPSDITEDLARAAACCEVLKPFAALPHSLTDDLGLGESAVIDAALTRGVGLVVIDELRGRRWARRLGLQVTGSLGLLVQLHRAGAIPSLETAFARMKAKGIYLDDKLLQKVLTLARSAKEPTPPAANS